MNNQNIGMDLKCMQFEVKITNFMYYFRFDEFGFRVEEEDGPEPVSNKLLSTSFIEDPQQR